MKHKIEKIEKSTTPVRNEQDIISELMDRHLNNIIVFNLPESTNQDQPRHHDKFKHMFNNII